MRCSTSCSREIDKEWERKLRARDEVSLFALKKLMKMKRNGVSSSEDASKLLIIFLKNHSHQSNCIDYLSIVRSGQKFVSNEIQNCEIDRNQF